MELQEKIKLARKQGADAGYAAYLGKEYVDCPYDYYELFMQWHGAFFAAYEDYESQDDA